MSQENYSKKNSVGLFSEHPSWSRAESLSRSEGAEAFLNETTGGDLRDDCPHVRGLGWCHVENVTMLILKGPEISWGVQLIGAQTCPAHPTKDFLVGWALPLP
jgi:hypothetical protein